mmetsp:Transcript_21735/g.64760  ORF Transcript_21735/g.64760 Transcript_21735/m.64760 type:complete len:222 (-) Transcript_21735:438-1103(-)
MTSSHFARLIACLSLLLWIADWCSSSLAAAALSTITARIRLVKPRATETRDREKIQKVQGCTLMMGTMQRPQESPATSVWKRSSVECQMLSREYGHQLRSHTTFTVSMASLWLSGCTISTVISDQMTSSTMIITSPQNIARIAPKKPMIITWSSGKNRMRRTARISRSVRKMRSIWSGGRLLSREPPPAVITARPMSRYPRETIMASRSFQKFLKKSQRRA